MECDIVLSAGFGNLLQSQTGWFISSKMRGFLPRSETRFRGDIQNPSWRIMYGQAASLDFCFGEGQRSDRDGRSHSVPHFPWSGSLWDFKQNGRDSGASRISDLFTLTTGKIADDLNAIVTMSMHTEGLLTMTPALTFFPDGCTAKGIGPSNGSHCLSMDWAVKPKYFACFYRTAFLEE